MNNEEYIYFLKRVLVKIENAINLMNHMTPRHIPSYNKMLGVIQKIEGSNKKSLAFQLITAKSTVSYFINGNYDYAYTQMLKLKGELIKICLELENEKDTVTKPQETRS